MRTISLTTLMLLACIYGPAQDHGFAYGKATYRELEMTQYPLDSAAEAVVLEEFGEAYIDNGNDHNLLFEYHVRIKILTQAGVARADVALPLYKNEGRSERIRSVRASSYNIEQGTMRESKFDPRNLFTENQSKYRDVTKFALPNVRVGSVIEYSYILESPFIYNFRDWEFQSDIPKVSSEYWATVPGNYIFNMSLTGFLKLSKSESELVKECFSPGGGNHADCARYKWGMKDVPAFREEEYMTARSNFLSRIHFELSEIEYFDGRKKKITKEWRDVDQELLRDERFGLQIKRGKDIVDQHISLVVAGGTDSLANARKIFDFIKEWYRWNGVFGIYSEFGIKKAFDKREGNVADINLSLVAALRYAGFTAEPLMLSTRANGLPSEIHPVISDFNYVIAKLTVGGKTHLLDATDDFVPFGLVPERCLNGKGRAFNEKTSYWHDIKPSEKSRRITVFTLVLGQDGIYKGTWQTNYSGYEALDMRKSLASASSTEEFIRNWSREFPDMTVDSTTISNYEDLSKPLVVKLTVQMEAFSPGQSQHFMFNPFIVGRYRENPFKSKERLYPVDFGAPRENLLIVSLQYPPEFEITELPSKIALSLPNAGGRYTYDVQNTGTRLSVNSALTITRSVYSSQEYHYLKELYNRVIAAQQADIVFRKKS